MDVSVKRPGALILFRTNGIVVYPRSSELQEGLLGFRWRMKKILIVCVAFSMLVACSDNGNVFKLGRRVYAIPSKTIMLTPSDSISGSCLNGINGLQCVIDSVLIFHLMDATGHSFRALDLRTSTYTDFLRIGRGPGEILMGYFSGGRKQIGQTLVDVSAMNEGVLLSIDLGETLRTGQTVIADTTEVLPFSLASYLVGDQVLSEVVNDEDIFSYKLYDREGQVVSRIMQPYGADEYLAYYQPLFNASKRMKPDGTKLCLGMVYFDELNILDLQGDEHVCSSLSRRLRGPEIIEESIETGKIGKGIYYVNLSVTDEKIIALYLEKNGPQEARSAIHVFSWDGLLESVYHTREPLGAITVSEDGRTLYGVTGEEVLYVYNI